MKKTLFVGGPWSGEIREVERTVHQILVVPNETDIEATEYPSPTRLALRQETHYVPMLINYFGMRVNVLVADDMVSSPNIESVVGLMLLNPDYRQVVS